MEYYGWVKNVPGFPPPATMWEDTGFLGLGKPDGWNTCYKQNSGRKTWPQRGVELAAARKNVTTPPDIGVVEEWQMVGHMYMQNERCDGRFPGFKTTLPKVLFETGKCEDTGIMMETLELKCDGPLGRAVALPMMGSRDLGCVGVKTDIRDICFQTNRQRERLGWYMAFACIPKPAFETSLGRTATITVYKAGSKCDSLPVVDADTLENAPQVLKKVVISEPCQVFGEATDYSLVLAGCVAGVGARVKSDCAKLEGSTDDKQFLMFPVGQCVNTEAGSQGRAIRIDCDEEEKVIIVSELKGPLGSGAVGRGTTALALVSLLLVSLISPWL